MLCALTDSTLPSSKVQRLIPKKQLFVAPVGGFGFAELAAFLGVPPPPGNPPYPHVNSSTEFEKLRGMLSAAAVLCISVPALLLAYVSVKLCASSPSSPARKKKKEEKKSA